jgi:CRISPR-associated protein Cas6
MLVELVYRLQTAGTIPADHGYLLFGALARLLPALHDDPNVSILPISGRIVGDRRMGLTPSSRLTLRTSDGGIAQLLPLAGKSLRLDDCSIRIGVPEVRSVGPAPTLRSRMVVIKVSGVGARELGAARFVAAARRQLADQGIGEAASLDVGKRRTVRVRDREVVGYEVVVDGLTADESLALLEHGLGGKRHLGCGVFVPVRQYGAE